MVKRLGVLGFVVLAGCATGTLASDDNTSEETPTPKAEDAGKTSSNDSGGYNYNTHPDSGGTQPPPTSQPDSGMTCMGTMCGGQCVDTTSDDNNCGMCGNACPSGASCVSSTCQCGTGTLCSSSCVDTSTDNNNCGKCGNVCSTSETCTSGTCTATSDAPPQGSCSHSLCSTGAALSDGCDTYDCTSEICDIVGDTYCCSVKWDSTCETEVTDYCSPYSCM